MNDHTFQPWGGAAPVVIDGGRLSHTFQEAAESYVRQGGSSRYLDKAIEYFRGRAVQSIAPAEIKQMALDLYPHHMASTRNRQGITPARAVIYHAHELGWCHHMRVRSFRTPRSTRHSPVDGAWLSAFINQADRDHLFHLSALAIFMNHTAARVSEAINVLGKHIDFRHRTALLVKTKTDVMATAYLTDELMYRLYNLDVKEGERVFRYKCRWAVNERIEAVCRRAGITYKSSHSVGRYSFATNAMNLGIGIKTAMDAGRWKSSKIFLETYVHTENAGRMVADRFNTQRYANL
jgi:site-specific recombinase XerD